MPPLLVCAWRIAVWLGSLLPLLLLAQVPDASPGLYSQATSRMLERGFPSPRVEYLLINVRSGETVAMRWPHAGRPIPVGSLLKPFVALAYGEMAASGASGFSPRTFPVVYCHGKEDGCWRAGGHGSLALERALADSCNAYFLALARDLTASGGSQSRGRDALDHVSAVYGLPAAPDQGAGEGDRARTLIGLTPEWRVEPAALAHAYGTLATQSHNDVVSRLLNGMRLAADPGGTAAKIGMHPGGVLAKTGTAPCVREGDHQACIASGDGLAVVLFPAEQPRFVLLVRRRGTTGAVAAEVAGNMLSTIEATDGVTR